MNKAFLIGNLTRDPELRTTSSGVSVCTFSLAINRRFTNQQGVREADFINIVAWRELGELCARYLTKGRKAGVVGTIQTRSYDAQDGTKRHVTEVVADEVEFLSSPQGGSGAPSSIPVDDLPVPPERSFPSRSSGGASPAPSAPASSGGFPDVEDDELPF